MARKEKLSKSCSASATRKLESATGEMKRKRKLIRPLIKLTNALATQLNHHSLAQLIMTSPQHLERMIQQRHLRQQLHHQPLQRHQLENVRIQITNMECLLQQMALEVVHLRLVQRTLINRILGPTPYARIDQPHRPTPYAARLPCEIDSEC